MAQNPEWFEDVAKAIALKVRKDLRANINKLENILESKNSRQRACEQFFRDLYQIPTLTQAINQLSATYLEDLLPEQIRNLVATQEEAVNIIAPTVLTAFEHNLRAGYYFMTPVDPEAAAMDVERILLRIPYRKHRQKEIIREHYGFTEKDEPKTIQEIAAERKQSKQNVSSLIAKGIQTLRELPATHELAIKYSSLGHKAELEEQAREEASKEITGLIQKVDDCVSGAASKESNLSREARVLLHESIESARRYFPTRVHYSLERNNITTVEELVRLTPAKLMSKVGFGKVKVKLVDDTLRQHGLYLGMKI